MVAGLFRRWLSVTGSAVALTGRGRVANVLEGYVAYTHPPHRPPRGGRLAAFALVRHARICMRGASVHCGMHVIRSDSAATDEHARANARRSNTNRNAPTDPDSYPHTHCDSCSDADPLSHIHPDANRHAHSYPTDAYTDTTPRPHLHADPHRHADAHPQAVDGVQTRQVPCW